MSKQSAAYTKRDALVLLFVFFTLTIGAGHGLLRSAKSADTRITAQTQTASSLLPLSGTSSTEGIQAYPESVQFIIPGVRVTPQVVGEGEQTMLVVYLDEDHERQLVYLPATNQYHVFSPGGNHTFLDADSPIVVNAKDAVAGGVDYDPLRVDIEPIALPDGTIPGVDAEGKIIAGRVVVPVSEDELGLTELEYDPATNEYYIYPPDATAPIGPLKESDPRVIEAKQQANGKKPATTTTPVAAVQQVDPSVFKTNRCSTTYIKVSPQGKTAVKDCYGTKQDVGYKTVQAFASCVASNSASPRTTDVIAKVYAQLMPLVEKGMCEGAEAKVVKTQPSGAFAKLNNNPIVIYPIQLPSISKSAMSACADEYNNVIGVMGGLNGNSSYAKTAQSANEQEAEACAWKGPSVCFEDPTNPGSFDCKAKATALTEKLTGGSILPITPLLGGNTNTQQECKGLKCFVQSVLKDSKFKQTIGQFVAKLVTGKKDCPSGYVVSGRASDGTAQCAPEPTKPQPQCVMAAQKTMITAGEEVLIRWKTANADSVDILGIGDDVNTEGEYTVRPAVTTTYTLTAHLGDTTKQCETTIVVDGQVTGPTGAYPPTLSCSPSNVLSGESARVTWTCPAQADESQGVGLNTQGMLGGEVTVLPTNNTQYRVACLKEGVEIGANICSVSLGNPQFDIIAYPTAVGKGERVRISWATLFMNRCRVQGPRAFDYAHTEGVVVTEPFSPNVSGTPQDATYTLECLTDYGTTVNTEVTVSYEE